MPASVPAPDEPPSPAEPNAYPAATPTSRATAAIAMARFPMREPTPSTHSHSIVPGGLDVMS